jgi:dethiobiotin synthetase
MAAQRYVVTGTDTGIGKTVFAAALAQALGAAYWKPVQAGTDDAGEGDAQTVARLTDPARVTVLPCAYELATPCSPHRAAEIDGLAIDPAQLALPSHAGPLVVEGAGGVLVPLNRQRTFADQFADWRLPVVLVARTALGTINHTLLSIEALRARGVTVHGVAFVGEPVPDSEETIATMGGVRRLGRLPHLERLESTALAIAFSRGFDMVDFAA